ncbi:cysteine desulfurase [Priestia megaterium]|uniref:Beta-eliminating lyase family protein n=1 Tax=Priestia megaterium (strain ATCC 14581 / DSM 32 / CCUG 1817 / JCM 2506 / NBRC 15308 / NCIMB 9376 / NCTC 10342 / NRRL B-14308 / VKM B-512 / Ford 19) TaxID=1348623 RepID=A0A0B6APS3_PRIM2|nr:MULTISPECIES: cysteine desulfurase family protein [Priestia]AJI22648.1 beta-eliminating lyase family protein [Priestia megaterium NBRC 15308 = ATCC 14581]KFN04968.1 beta-eliminating lyase family protein [Priestia megaterium]KGJ78644.1 cysteine desulfurase [Priestia megaterium NBRC 15308 = ATCC 14581]MCU7708810.1 cysteine desulfurase [Priestia megaterium]MCW1046356.1 cysteine desulfurase [Priestia sp. JV24]
MHTPIYFDYNATTPIDPRVLEGMLPYLQNHFGNPSSTYSIGYRTKEAIEMARKDIANLISVEDGNVFFTSGGSEANSTILKGIAAKSSKKKHIITSSIEHPAILKTCDYLRKHHGFQITTIPVNPAGIVDVNDIERAITSQTVLVTVMMVNNEIGSIQPIKEIGNLCKKHNIHFHCDAVQAVGKIPVNLKELPIDSLSMSAHKIYGPKGVGCLYLREGVNIPPLILGGSQEFGMRSGTENVAGIVGFGIAAKIVQEDLYFNLTKIEYLRNLFLTNLHTEIEECLINGDIHASVPSTINIQISGIRGESLASMLNELGFCVSIASACSSTSSKLSHVLKAIGKTDEEIRSSIRISIGALTTEDEINQLVRHLKQSVMRLRSFSPKYQMSI